MANEISINTTLSLTKSMTMAGNQHLSNLQTVGTSWEAGQISVVSFVVSEL